MILQNERDKCAHLLRRFALGASEAELDYYLQGGGLNGAIDKLLNYEQVDEGFNLPIEAFENAKNVYKAPQVQAWWLLRMVKTQRPLQEKMTLFWHNHFATSSDKVVNAPSMYKQNEILRANATGHFRKLISEVSKDPAMLFWLDNEFNVRGKPNENFAREVMELFTLGIGHYTEKDIQESARAFTGWTFGRPNAKKGIGKRSEFTVRDDLHDDGVKTFLSNTGQFDGDDILGILCGNPRTPVFLTHKIWEWFVYPNPDPALIDGFATNFRDSGLDIKTLLRNIMQSPEFYSDKAFRANYKNPIDFCVAPMRQLGFGQMIDTSLDGEQVKRAALAPIQALNQTTKAQGMEMLYPPDVSGWGTGPKWISSATMIERIKWGERIFGASPANGPKNRTVVLRYDASTLFEKDPTPVGVVRKLISIFDAPIPPTKQSILVNAAKNASGGRVTAENANDTAGAVARLIFGCPEFQMI